MAQLVNNEIPSGLIDSNNTTYTLSMMPITIVAVIVDGMDIPSAYTITGNTLVLTVAPTTTIIVDYLATGYSSSPSANLTTLQDLRDTFYDILRETEQDSTAYPLGLVDLLLNAAEQKIVGGRVISPVSKEEARKGVMHFLNQDAYYSNVKSTYLNQDATVGATELYADPTAYPTAGKLYLGGQIVSYTGVDTILKQFTGCSGVLFPFPAGTQISIAFAMPTDFSSIINVTYNNKIKLPPKQYDDIFEDLNSFKGSNFQRMNVTSMYESPYRIKPFYTIKDSQYLLCYQLNDTGYPIHLRYEKLHTKMVAPSDACMIDDDTFARTTIPYLAVAEMMYNRGEEQRAAELFSFAISQCKIMYSWYNDTSFESQNGVQYKMGKGKLNI